jgi:transposase, IS30 family
MIKKFVRLTFEERIKIEKLLSHNKSYSHIAEVLDRHKSTIQRDVSKQGRGNYRAMLAENIAVGFSSNRKSGKSKINLCPNLKNFVHDKLYLRWSPRQISMTLKKEFPTEKEMQLSHETVYLYIYIRPKAELNMELMAYLRQKRKFRGNVRRGADKRTTIKDPIRIDERPKEVLGRLIPGHWEGDLVMGKERNSAIGTLVERTTRTIIIVHLKARDATSVRKAFEKEFKNIPATMKLTMTYDNGTEMAQHKLFTKNTKIKVYFAHPYSPWERPTNENSNGLIRDYFPKGTDFSLVSKKELKRVQNELNERPRNVLNWRTPKEVFDEFILNKIGEEKVN